MRFLVDNQLPLALARWLTGRGHFAVHLLDLRMTGATDSQIWMQGTSEQGIIVSKDDDFFILANRSHDTGRLLWVRVGNCRTSTLLARFENAWPAIENAFTSGQRVVELR